MRSLTSWSLSLRLVCISKLGNNTSKYCLGKRKSTQRHHNHITCKKAPLTHNSQIAHGRVQKHNSGSLIIPHPWILQPQLLKIGRLPTLWGEVALDLRHTEPELGTGSITWEVMGGCIGHHHFHHQIAIIIFVFLQNFQMIFIWWKKSCQSKINILRCEFPSFLKCSPTWLT